MLEKNSQTAGSRRPRPPRPCIFIAKQTCIFAAKKYETIGKFATSCQMLEGSSSAVSKPRFASTETNINYNLIIHFEKCFKIYSRPYRAKKKCEHFLLPKQINIWRRGKGGSSNFTNGQGALAKRIKYYSFNGDSNFYVAFRVQRRAP